MSNDPMEHAMLEEVRRDAAALMEPGADRIRVVAQSVYSDDPGEAMADILSDLRAFAAETGLDFTAACERLNYGEAAA